jgi:hypothetical protein
MYQSVFDLSRQIPGLRHVAVLQLIGQCFQDGTVSARGLEQGLELCDFLLEIRTLPRHAALNLIWLLNSLF